VYSRILFEYFKKAKELSASKLLVVHKILFWSHDGLLISLESILDYHLGLQI